MPCRLPVTTLPSSATGAQPGEGSALRAGHHRRAARTGEGGKDNVRQAVTTRRCLRSGRSLGLALAVLLVATTAAGQDPPRFTEKVDVVRVLLDVRAIDPRGRPLLGLEPANFEVRIDSKRARVESVQYVTGASLDASTTPGTARPNAVDGRLVVDEPDRRCLDAYVDTVAKASLEQRSDECRAGQPGLVDAHAAEQPERERVLGHACGQGRSHALARQVPQEMP